jgi:type IV secretory pathway TrbD component
VVSCVSLHYEGLSSLARRQQKSSAAPRRRRVLFDILGIVFLHVTEIWIFGIAIWLLLMADGTGQMGGAVHHPLLDAVYLSAMSYTTVGYGDVLPEGSLRFLAGTEALLGLVLITWSASFTFLEMQRNWSR